MTVKVNNCIDSVFFCQELNTVSQKITIKLAYVFTAEYIAIEDAVDFALNNNNRNFLIFSDALSVLLSLASMKINIRTNPYILNVNKFNRENLNNFIKFY